MAEFTRYQLRKRVRDLGIEVRYGQFEIYITKGLLPDPELEPWAEQAIVTRFLRIHELEPRARSLDRRVVILYLERYPIPPEKLREAMIGMLPTISPPTRKMSRVAAAGQWFAAAQGEGSSLGKGDALPPSSKPPKRSEWVEILRNANIDVFTHRLGITQYYASLLATFGKGTPHALDDLDPEEKLVLLMIEYLAAWQWFQAQGRARQEQASEEGNAWS